MKKKFWKALAEGFQESKWRQNLKSIDGYKWKINQWNKIDYTKVHGFDYSELIIDSMEYMEVLAQVEVRSKEMRIVKAWRWKKEDSVALAIYAASLVLKYFEKKYPNDKRPREAIGASKAWLKNPSQKSRKAAETAAWSAVEIAQAAADPEGEAAWSASEAREVASEAARAAVGYAARAAEVAEAEADKIRDCCERWIRRRISKLEVLKIADFDEKGGQ